ncbi:MAG: hypothetical protein ACREOE_00645, partial [Gemmatimonadales bacterium]
VSQPRRSATVSGRTVDGLVGVRGGRQQGTTGLARGSAARRVAGSPDGRAGHTGDVPGGVLGGGTHGEDSSRHHRRLQFALGDHHHPGAVAGISGREIGEPLVILPGDGADRPSELPGLAAARGDQTGRRATARAGRRGR